MAHMESPNVHARTPDAVRARSLPRTDIASLVRVSRLYYELGETQDAIAHRLGVTRPHVSKLLKQARTSGIVEIRIVDRLADPDTVARDVASRFGLHAVHLAPTFVDSDVLTRRRVGRLGAEVLIGILRSGMTVGVGDGAAVTALADALADLASPIEATIVPLCGGFWGAEATRDPYRRIADALGAATRGLLAPGLLDDEATRNALAGHAGIRAVTDLWSHLDVAVFGIGSRSWSEASVGPEALAEIEAGKAVGEVLIAPIDLEGRFVGSLLRRRTIAFDARALPGVPVAIGIASGHSKVEPIIGALRAGIVGTLVTDLETAAAVLDLDRARQVPTARAPGGDG